MKECQWICCPVCGNKTRLKMREDTVIENFPLYCPKCRQETIINSKQTIPRVVSKTEYAHNT